MPSSQWRKRLAQAVEDDPRSLRAISQAAGLPDSAVWEMLNTSKEPRIGKLLAVCEALGVSISYILEGIELSPENERFLKAFSRMSKDQQDAWLQILERQR